MKNINAQLMRLIYSILIICSVSFFYACKNDGKKSGEESVVVPQEVQYDSFSEQLASANTSSREFIRVIRNSGFPYVEQLVNDPFQYRDYKQDINISAANIGIYMTDAQYLNIYNKEDQADFSAKAAQRLFRLIETNTLDTSLLQLQKGFRKRDSALFELNQALKDSVNDLSNYDRRHYILSMSYGIFIERNYILLNLLNEPVEEADIQALTAYLIKHNDQLKTLLDLRQGDLNKEYHTYLAKDMLAYQEYYLANKTVLTKKVIEELLLQIDTMRKYIVYSGLLLRE